MVLTGVCGLKQEQEALVAELTDVAQRQRAKIGALARERTELAARPAADPAQLEALRAEAAALQDRLRLVTAAKACPAVPPVQRSPHHTCCRDGPLRLFREEHSCKLDHKVAGQV